MKKGLFSIAVLTFAVVGMTSCKPAPEPAPEPTPEEKPLPEGCIKDYDGNVYETIVIGKQTWMKENLKTTHYADGTPIENLEDSATNVTTSFYTYPSGIKHNVMIYGLLYNWQAATRGKYSYQLPSGVQGICPDGWHVPSKREWQQLFNYVSSQEEYICSDNSANIAKALASKERWMPYEESRPACSPCEDAATNDITGFSLKPCGSDVHGVGYEAFMWTTGESGSTGGISVSLITDVATVSDRNFPKTRLIGVRCVKD